MQWSPAFSLADFRSKLVSGMRLSSDRATIEFDLWFRFKFKSVFHSGWKVSLRDMFAGIWRFLTFFVRFDGFQRYSVVLTKSASLCIFSTFLTNFSSFFKHTHFSPHLFYNFSRSMCSFLGWFIVLNFYYFSSTTCSNLTGIAAARRSAEL